MDSLKMDCQKYEDLVLKTSLTQEMGKVTQVVGQLLCGFLPGATVGSLCRVHPTLGEEPFMAEVVGFKERTVMMMPLGKMGGVGLGAKIVLNRSAATIRCGPEILGRVIDSLGNPIDSLGALEVFEEMTLYTPARSPLERKPIREPLDLGVRAINTLLSVGQGQRIGIMAGSGVGKSVLLGMIARYTKADVNVIALVGERGREVREFIENDLGPEGMAKSVLVVATSDQSPLMRMRAGFVAAAIAEYFSNRGQSVLFMMDSITRFAMAQREIGLSIGEPPTSKGYTPSVYAMLPRLLEKSGCFEKGGSITGVFTVLVEGDDMDDPIGDSVRSLVDGHIVLLRKLAQKGHFPAIDILQSSSRVMRHVIDSEKNKLAQRFRALSATYREAEDLINIGAYKNGANPKIDEAIRLNDSMNTFLKQAVEESSEFETGFEELRMTLGG